MTNKMTYVVALNTVIDNMTIAEMLGSEVIEKLTALRDAQAKKNSAERKPTAKQKENSQYKADIVAFMEVGKKYRVSELLKLVPSLAEAELNSQRVTPMLTQLVTAGEIVRTEEKRQAYYSLAE